MPSLEGRALPSLIPTLLKIRHRLDRKFVFLRIGISTSLVKRAEVAGCKAIVLTVDVPVLGGRERCENRSVTGLPRWLIRGGILLSVFFFAIEVGIAIAIRQWRRNRSKRA